MATDFSDVVVTLDGKAIGRFESFSYDARLSPSYRLGVSSGQYEYIDPITLTTTGYKMFFRVVMADPHRKRLPRKLKKLARQGKVFIFERQGLVSMGYSE